MHYIRSTLLYQIFRVYRDQLHQYKRQLQQLKEGTYAPYIKRLKKLEQMHNDRLLMNEIYVKNELQLIEEDYEKEKELALQEFEVNNLLCGY